MKKIFVLLLITILFFNLVSIAQAVAAEKKIISQQGRLVPREVKIDTNGDGKPDRIEKYNTEGAIISIEADTDKNGTTDEWLYYENAKLVKAAKDTTGDGKQDTWITY